MQHQAITTWLKSATAIVIATGLLCLSGAFSATSGLTLTLLDIVFWPADGIPGETMPQTRLLWAICGGLMAGWGVLMWQVITHIYTGNPALGRSMILTSVGIWFVLDSAGSFAAGAPLNVLFNSVFLVIYAIPLWRPAQSVSDPA